MTASLPDPMAARPETRELLSSPRYREAYARAVSGAETSDDDRDVIEHARALTGTPGPGLPQPIREDVS
jgi:hypothetical protein